MAVGGSVTYTAPTRLGKLIAFAEKLDNKSWNGCNGCVFITAYAADIIFLLFSSILGLTVRIPEAEVMTSTLC